VGPSFDNVRGRVKDKMRDSSSEGQRAARAVLSHWSSDTRLDSLAIVVEEIIVGLNVAPKEALPFSRRKRVVSRKRVIPYRTYIVYRHLN